MRQEGEGLEGGPSEWRCCSRGRERGGGDSGEDHGDASALKYQHEGQPEQCDQSRLVRTIRTTRTTPCRLVRTTCYRVGFLLCLRNRTRLVTSSEKKRKEKMKKKLSALKRYLY